MSTVEFHCQTYPTAVQFLQQMRPLLEADEARNGLMLGLAECVAIDPHAYGDADPYFATVAAHATSDSDQGIVAAALMTPPYGLLLYAVPELGVDHTLTRVLTPIFANLQELELSVPTVNGPAVVAERFAAIWSTMAGIAYELVMATRIFMLRAVNHPPYSPGRLMPATAAEHVLAVQWSCDFALEAEHREERVDDRLHKTIAQKIADGQLYFWVDGEPVSMVGLIRPTAHGISIGPVYTPPALRGRGYASSAVAQLSQQMLDSGKDFCVLFTDVANPTSNHIYQAIGYRALVDFQVYRFVPSVGVLR